jgi:hypothetical protein
MCMQPWFFSMGRLHLGHGLELARIQFMFSLSALFFCTHFATVSQSTGRCASWLQFQQKPREHLHTMSHGFVDAASTAPHSTAYTHLDRPKARVPSKPESVRKPVPSISSAISPKASSERATSCKASYPYVSPNVNRLAKHLEWTFRSQKRIFSEGPHSAPNRWNLFPVDCSRSSLGFIHIKSVMRSQ